MAFVHKDRARVTVAVGGAGALALGVAVQDAAKGYYQTFGDDGVANGDTFAYIIEDGAAWESGIGAYSSASPSMTRTMLQSSTGALLNVTTAAQISVTLLGSIVDKMLRADLDGQQITGGANIVPGSLGTVSSGTLTPDPGNGPMQYATNNGAFSLAPSANKGTYILEILNGASAGAIATAGWTTVKGDSFSVVNAAKFTCSCIIGQNSSTLIVVANQ